MLRIRRIAAQARAVPGFPKPVPPDDGTGLLEAWLKAQEIRFQRKQERAEANLTDEEIRAEHERYRKWFEASGRYPRITRLMESGIDPDDPATRDERFQFGLDCVLDGVAARLAAG
jgi:hypothetical protein